MARPNPCSLPIGSTAGGLDAERATQQSPGRKPTPLYTSFIFKEHSYFAGQIPANRLNEHGKQEFSHEEIKTQDSCTCF
jgi:hypothetical protein